MSKVNPDIICLQETKAHKDQVNLILDDYPYKFWNSAQKKGYSGVSTWANDPFENDPVVAHFLRRG